MVIVVRAEHVPCGGVEGDSPFGMGLGALYDESFIAVSSDRP
jgi:hypothetical protein